MDLIPGLTVFGPSKKAALTVKLLRRVAARFLNLTRRTPRDQNSAGIDVGAALLAFSSGGRHFSRRVNIRR